MPQITNRNDTLGSHSDPLEGSNNKYEGVESENEFDDKFDPDSEVESEVITKISVCLCLISCKC